MAKILIVDDHPLYREGVITALARCLPGSEVLGAASVGDGLAVLDADSTVELVLVDLHMPGLDGFAALALYGARHPGVARVLISGQSIDAAVVERTMRTGASGFITKAISVARMVDAIRDVLAGGIAISTGADDECTISPAADEREAMSAAARPADFEQVSGAMSVRQLEVLALLGQGRSNKEIARRLDIAERTVKAHATRVFEVLGATNRTQAVLAAQKLGLLVE